MDIQHIDNDSGFGYLMCCRGRTFVGTTYYTGMDRRALLGANRKG